MAIIESFPKGASQGGFAYGADQGMNYVCGAGTPGVSVQFLLKTASGASELITFADEGLQDMADESYCVFIQGETGGGKLTAYVTEANKKVDSITVESTAASQVLNIMIVGRVQGQSAL